MSTQTCFTLRNRNPDVPTCIANLSNDEVFTPPEFANRMLDTLAETWASDNDSADRSVKPLDPFTKSDIFPTVCVACGRPCPSFSTRGFGLIHVSNVSVAMLRVE